MKLDVATIVLAISAAYGTYSQQSFAQSSSSIHIPDPELAPENGELDIPRSQRGDQVVPRPRGSNNNPAPPNSAVAPGSDSNCVVSQYGIQTMALMQRAMSDLSSPDKRVYIEYNGELFPLKGIVKVPQIDANGAEVRVPLSAEEVADVKNDIERLKSSQKSLTADLKKVSERKELLKKKTSQSNANEIERLKADLRQLDDEEIRLQHRERTEFAELSNQIEQLDEVRVVGKRFYAPVRVDSQQQVAVLTQSFGQPVTAMTVPAHAGIQQVESSVGIVEKRNVDYRRPEFRLPAPADPNDLFYSPQTDPAATRLGLAPHLTKSLLGETLSLEDISTVARITPSFGAFFDTRTVATDSEVGNFDVSKISTVRSPLDGTTKYIGSNDVASVVAPTAIILDNQVQDALRSSFGESQVQFYLEGNNFQQLDELTLRHWYGRVWNKGTWSATAGKTQSLFSTGSLAPASLSQSMTLVGASGLGTAATRKQFRIQQRFTDHEEGIAWGLGIEDAASSDFSILPAAGTVLTRWPTITGNITLAGNGETDVIQLSALYRNLGVQMPSAVERFEDGWGLGLFACQQIIQTRCDRGSIFAGAAGGRGIGNYINGVQTAAVISGGDLIALKGFGAYAGYKHDRILFNKWHASSNLAYGISDQSVLPTMAKETSTNLHQFWANIYVKVNDQVSFGTEWQYGRRLTLSDGNGENHRIFFGVQLTSKKTGKTTSAIANTRVLSERYSAENLISTDRELMNAEELSSSRAYQQRL